MKFATILISLLQLLVVIPFIGRKRIDASKWRSIAIGLSFGVVIMSIVYIISFL